MSLYNGKIARQTIAIDTFQRLTKSYIYDQLNRIHAGSYPNVDPSTGALTSITDFSNRSKDEADGNITKLVRYGNNTGSGASVMDSLSCYYSSGCNNKLITITDSSADAPSNALTNCTYTVLLR